MNITVIDTKDVALKIHNDAIKFAEHNIPLKSIDMLLLNHKIMLQTKDILTLTKNEITVLLISYNNDNFSRICSANSKGGDLKLAQYNALQKRVTYAKYFLTQKLVSHQEQLKEHGIAIDISEKLLQIDQAPFIDSLMGIEGSFAREYFSHFFSLIPKKFHKARRSKRPPKDPVNALLSYWYSLYYHIIEVQLLSHGFEPAIGYLHAPFRSHSALASDFLELFRASINQAVIGIFKNELLSVSDFSKKGGVYLKFTGRKKIWSEFIKLVAVLKPMLDKEIALLRRNINENP